MILEHWDAFGKAFGRYYHPVEKYRTEGAKTLLLTLGSFGETAMTAVDKMRNEGKEVGLLKLRLWRPFPFAELREAVGNAQTLIVVDRAFPSAAAAARLILKSGRRCTAKRTIRRLSALSAVWAAGTSPLPNSKTWSREAAEIANTGAENEYEMFGVRE